MKPTQRQEKLANLMVDNLKKDIPDNKATLLAEAGYSLSTGKAYPSRIIESTGVQMALKERGFSIEAADGVVQEIMHSRKSQNKDKLRAADMIYDRLGAKAPERVVQQSISVTGSPKEFVEAEALRLKYEEDLRLLYESNEAQ